MYEGKIIADDMIRNSAGGSNVRRQLFSFDESVLKE